MDQAKGCVLGQPNKEDEPGTHIVGRNCSLLKWLPIHSYLGALPKTQPRDVAEGVVQKKCKTLNSGPLGLLYSQLPLNQTIPKIAETLPVHKEETMMVSDTHLMNGRTSYVVPVVALKRHQRIVLWSP